jgi:hypothetical protein
MGEREKDRKESENERVGSERTIGRGIHTHFRDTQIYFIQVC